MYVTIRQVVFDSENLTSHWSYNKPMEKLDQLIQKFKEVKEELQKSDSPLHDTVEGFMGGLKALPKGSAERGKFITAHMSHGPFVGALNAHPQGKQLHGMLMNHLNSPVNAGPKAVGGVKVVAKSVDEDLDDFLQKAYVSPWYKFGPSKKVAAPAKAEGPAKPTGIDKIKHVSQEKIQPTSIVSDDRKRAASMGAPSNPTNPNKPAKLTGLDRIKAESQKPITATTVKKDEDEDKEDDEKKDLKKGLFSSASTSPKKPFVPSFQGHKAALGAVTGAQTNAKGVTTERSFDPLKQETSKKKFISVPFGKTVNQSYTPQTNMAMSCGEKVSLSKAGQWSLSKEDDDKTPISPTKLNEHGKAALSAPKNEWHPGQTIVGKLHDLPRGDPNQKHQDYVAPKPAPGAKVSPITTSIPKLKPAGEKYARVSGEPSVKKDETGMPKGTVAKDEASDHCSKCEKKPCVCIKTKGVLVDKMDGGDMSVGGGV